MGTNTTDGTVSNDDADTASHSPRVAPPPLYSATAPKRCGFARTVVILEATQERTTLVT